MHLFHLDPIQQDIFDRTQEHVLRVLSRVKHEPEPFSHFYVTDLLPDELYDMIIDNPPPNNFYKPMDSIKYGREDGTPTREQVAFFEAASEPGLPPDCQLWMKPLYNVFFGPSFKDKVFNKLAPGLAERFGQTEKLAQARPCHRDIRLFKDTKDYEIIPHRDTFYKLVTFQMYLPRDEENLNLGTSLYVVEEGYDKERYRGFRKVKQFPFAPNSAYAFVVNKGPKHVSWHGRERLTDADVERNSLMVIFEDRTLPK